LRALKKRLAEASEQQTAIGEILRLIARSPGDLKAMLNAVAARALKLCDAADATILLVEGNKLRAAARFGSTPSPLEEEQFLPLTRGSVSGRAVIDCDVIHLEDLATAPEAEFPIGRQMQRQLGHHAILSVPLMREDHAIGAISVWRMEARRFTSRQIALVKTFADQAVIAIENVRLFEETKRLLKETEQRMAELAIINSVQQGLAAELDFQAIIDLVGDKIREIFNQADLEIRTYDPQTKLMHFPYYSQNGRRIAIESHPLGETGFSAHVIRTRETLVINDNMTSHIERYGSSPLAGAKLPKSGVMVPVVMGDQVRAIIALEDIENEHAFSASDVSLLQTLASAMSVALENARLFDETKEALERQTATSEILRVISQSPRDVQPVFDSIAAAALKLCRAGTANVFTFDGQMIHVAAFANADSQAASAIREVFPRPPSRDTAVARAVLTGSVVAIPDVLQDAEYLIAPAALAAGFRSALAVPLMRKGNPIGVIGVGLAEPGVFPDKQIALLQTFADQAVIAIENVRLFTELEARTHQLSRSVGELKALGEVGQAVSSTLDLETVLSTIVSRAARLAGMDGGSVWEYDEVAEEFHLHATDRLPRDLVEILRERPIRKGEGALGRLAITGEPVEIYDFADQRSYQSRLRESLIRSGYRSVLAVPLLREDHLLGALAVNRSSPGGFAPEVVELLKTFATQSALAIQNARLYREIEQKSRELESASRHKSEFLANMSHELRTPLNAIIGFSEVLSERMFGEINEKQAEYIGDILESGRHLLSLINDILDLSKIEAGRMELELSDFDLPSTIENTLILVRERAQRRGITLGCTIDERLGTIRADERKVKQVLLNLLSNALKFTSEGGKIDVRAAVNDGAAEISVIDTGVGIAPEDQATVFEEFRQVGTAAKKVEGTGLGLAISRKFIELHGGRIWVQSQIGSGSTFAFTLPLR
jgi:signal transduction histidine kinase